MKPGQAETLARIALTIKQRKSGDPAKSYVAKLFAHGDDAMLKKIGEEATETVLAAKSGDRLHLVREVTDLWFHCMIVLERYGLGLDTLGLERSKQWGNMPAVEFDTGNLTIAIMQSDAFGLDFRPNNHPVALHVDDFDAAKAELESRGVEFKGDVIDSGVCKQQFFDDPDGNVVGIHHRYAPGG